jgi:hypothetical protein
MMLDYLLPVGIVALVVNIVFVTYLACANIMRG